MLNPIDEHQPSWAGAGQKLSVEAVSTSAGEEQAGCGNPAKKLVQKAGHKYPRQRGVKSSAPFVAAHFEHITTQLTLADFTEVLDPPSELPIQIVWQWTCKASIA